MKKIIIALIGLFATFAAYAQKSKENTIIIKPSIAQYNCQMLQDLVSNMPGKYLNCDMNTSSSKKEQMKKEVTQNPSCPMHAGIESTNKSMSASYSSRLVINRVGSKQPVLYALAQNNHLVQPVSPAKVQRME